MDGPPVSPLCVTYSAAAFGGGATLEEERDGQGENRPVMAWLKSGQRLRSDESGRYYRVVSNRVYEGGFGEVYRGHELDDHEDDGPMVAIKVTDNAQSWHGEAFFGRLLQGKRHVVPLLDAFVVPGNPSGPTPIKYVLVMPWLEDGTVNDLVEGGDSWPDTAVLEGIRDLLSVLSLLHGRGICHGDITPRNVFVRGGELLLGDLGIAGLTLDDGEVQLIGETPEPYQPQDRRWGGWSPAADVYQVGLLALTLLSGECQAWWDVSGKTLKALPACDHLKGWIREACSPARRRFIDARDALVALESPPPDRRLLPGPRRVVEWY
jgi:serine/threonine protein kinase